MEELHEDKGGYEAGPDADGNAIGFTEGESRSYEFQPEKGGDNPVGYGESSTRSGYDSDNKSSEYPTESDSYAEKADSDGGAVGYTEDK